ncbi:Uncharacterized protein FWK35_00038203, partial [Aphis craccivora]
MAPKTNILQNYGTQIGYNEYLPVAFRLDSEWYGVSPIFREIKNTTNIKIVHFVVLELQNSGTFKDS